MEGQGDRGVREDEGGGARGEERERNRDAVGEWRW